MVVCAFNRVEETLYVAERDMTDDVCQGILRLFDYEHKYNSPHV